MIEPPRDPEPRLDERELPRPPDLDVQRGAPNDDLPPVAPQWWATRAAVGFYVAVGIATIISGVTALFGSPFTGDTSPGAQPTQAGVTAPATSSSRSSSSGASVRQGVCLDGSNQSVPCAIDHRYEIVAVPAATCSVGDAIRYLGGHVARDVLLVPPTPVSLPDGTQACVVGDPGKGLSSGSAKGVLRTSASARWRRCADEMVDDTTVPCSVPHTAEFIGIEGLVADAETCKRAAEAYMGVGLDHLSDRLTVAVVPTKNVADGNPRCVIRVLGNAILTDTLRDVRAGTLPVSARE